MSIALSGCKSIKLYQTVMNIEIELLGKTTYLDSFGATFKRILGGIDCYPGASSIDILDHIKPSLWKEQKQIIIHAGTNDISNNISYLKNVKKIVELVNKTCKDTKLSFSSVICCTDIKDITDTINTTNSHAENCCK